MRFIVREGWHEAHAVLVRDLVLWVFVVSVASLAGFRLLAVAVATLLTIKLDALPSRWRPR